MDGVRSYWNGRKMISRHNKEIQCPQWFTQELPNNISLDGELWIGKGKLEPLVGILNGSSMDDDWNQVKYVIFDLPNSKESYEHRMEELQKMKFPNHIQKVEMERCNGNDHLQTRLHELTQAGGEGLMAVQPGSPYISGRVSTLLKIKVYFAFKNIN
jgi:DNA ligase-1